jgi:DNA-binding beta-propeller fold protein YncE
MTKKKLGSVKNTDEVVITACDLANDVTGTLPVTNGGTGQTTYTNGQLLIGNTTGNTLTKAALTQGTGITITNGAGSITIASSMSGSDYVAKAGDNMTGVLELNESAQIGASATTDLGTATGNTVTIATTSASYASKSMSVSSQDDTPTGLSFSSDGTKCYVVGITNDTVYQYTLSTAWDISTGSYASKSMSVSSQETSPVGLSFSSDGTKCYVIGYDNDTVYQYTLSTAWDISTGSYASKSMSVTSQETSPRGLAFSSDGTKCYVVGTTNDTVYQYTLSTAWDISTGSYASKSMSVTSQETTPQGLAFSSDGTKCYVIGSTSDTIYQYTLSTAWDISTGSYASKSMSVSSQETSPVGLSFSLDGTKCYVVGTTNDTVYQYTLDSAWELTNVSTAITSFGAASSLQSGTIIHCRASVTNGTLSLTHNATSLKIPGSTNLTLADGDMFDVRKTSDSSAYWEVIKRPSVLTSGTQKTLSTGSPTYVDFTSIPPNVKMIVIMINGLSGRGTSNFIIQIGDSGGIETSGYAGSTGNINTGTSVSMSSGFTFAIAATATHTYNVMATLTLMDSSTNTWMYQANTGFTSVAAASVSCGSKSLSATLDRVRLTTVGGTDTFDAGTMNISYVS